MTTYEEIKSKREADLKAIFNHFRAINQLNKLHEEVEEFMDVFTCFYRHDPTDENWEYMIAELADVDVVLDQFKLILSDDAQRDGKLYHTLLEKKKAEKIERTLDRMRSGYYDRG